MYGENAYEIYAPITDPIVLQLEQSGELPIVALVPRRGRYSGAIQETALRIRTASGDVFDVPQESNTTISSDADRRPLCLVLMPFGSKDDPAAGKVHFDAVYQELIKPAVEDGGLQCVRADEEWVGGIIHKPMFERLLLCDYAVVDLSMANARVYYELGIRHATRPWSTVLLFQEGYRLPFDVNPLRALPYHLGRDGRPAPVQVEADRAALTGKLRDAKRRATDSPVFQLLTGLEPPDMSVLDDTELFRERVEAATALQDRLAAARQAGDLDGLHAVQADLGSLADASAGLLIDLLQSYRAVEAHADVVNLIAAMPAVLRRAPQVREHRAFALNRLTRRREAEDILLQLIDERGPDSETNGLLGRVYKDQWEEALAQGRTRAAAVLLDKAIDAYLTGFAADWRDHYPGINAVQLMHLRDPSDPRIADLLPVVRYGAQLKARRHQADFWDHATLVELAVLAEDADSAFGFLAHAFAAGPLPWQARSLLDTLVRLRRARERTRPSPSGCTRSRPNWPAWRPLPLLTLAERPVSPSTPTWRARLAVGVKSGLWVRETRHTSCDLLILVEQSTVWGSRTRPRTLTCALGGTLVLAD